MQKVLIIGLGGSGGKTLAFLMDELKVRLGDEWEGRLPACWKFIHIDVPTQADGQGANLATPVREQGGTYVGLAHDSNLSYSSYDNLAMDVLQKQRPAALDLAVRWRPIPSQADAIDVNGGAGAFRAVGRMVTVARAEGIYAALRSAVQALNSVQANEDLDTLAAQIKAPAAKTTPPLVFMVSGLAGGSGASMVLDVADMLRGLSKHDGFDGEHTSAFLYTADVFKSLKLSSAGPGSLATISELIGAMSRQGEPWNSKEWEALGIGSASLPRAQGRGPHMIFPVGAKTAGIPFGETPEDVYRGFARMLSPLFIDDHIQKDFYYYVTVNGPQDVVDSGDLTGLAVDPISKRVYPSHFAGWGSAVLSMGRERYTEYSAQRVAREAVEVLVNGFVDQDFIDKKINLQQAIQRGVEAVYPSFLDIAGLSLVTSTDGVPLVQAIIPTQARNAFASARTVELAVEFSGRTGEITAGALANFFTRNMPGIKSAAVNEGLKSISVWAAEVQRNVEDAFLNIAAQRGLRVANECLKNLVSDFNRIQVDLETKTATSPPTLEKTLQDGIASARKLGRAPVANGGQFAANFMNAYAVELGKQVIRDGCTSLAAILGDFSKNFIVPLIDKSNAVLAELEYELGRDTKSVVTAAYREAPVSQWPVGSESVPRHFNPAVNEVLIDGVDKFPAFFDAHVTKAVVPFIGDSVREAARQVITRTRLDRAESGRGFESVVGWNWKRTALDSHPNINRTKSWQPKELSMVDGRPQSVASFELSLGYKDILGLARTWVNLPACPFRQHGEEGIAEWLSPKSELSSQEAAERRQKLQQKLNQAITLASPLVEIDSELVSAVHGPSKLGIVYSFSAVPFDSTHPILSDLLNSWASTNSGATNAANLKEAASGSTDKSEIFILGQTFRPYLPLVFKSLTQPIRDEWSSAISSPNNRFWQWRRARPLRQFVPISQRHLAAFIQGWTVGRITGLIQLSDANDGANGKVVRVHDAADGAWLEFPRKLLGSDSLGVKSNAPGQDEASWNVPAILLESLPLAMAHCQGQNLSPISPYLAVMNLGYSLKVAPESEAEPVGGPGNVLNALDTWFTHGSTSGFQSQIEPAQGSSPEERRQNAKTWLEKIATYMQNLATSNITLQNFYSVNREYEIAPEVINACRVVIRELERDDLGSANDGDNPTATTLGATSTPSIVSGGDAVEG